jgi:hypothetical protein
MRVYSCGLFSILAVVILASMKLSFLDHFVLYLVATLAGANLGSAIGKINDGK